MGVLCSTESLETLALSSMDPLSLRALWTSSGSSVIRLCMRREGNHVACCGGFNLPNLKIAYTTSIHIPLARTQSSHIADPDYKRFWEMWSSSVFRKKKWVRLPTSKYRGSFVQIQNCFIMRTGSSFLHSCCF